MTDVKEYKFQASDIFEEIPDNAEEILMKIPEEIAEAQGWKPGDTLKISIGDQGTIIINKVKDGEE
jgi:frataxin-like iron-binding protein CyaY